MCPMNAELGRLEQVDPRLVWTHAAHDCRVADYKGGCTVADVNRYYEFIDWFLMLARASAAL